MASVFCIYMYHAISLCNFRKQGQKAWNLLQKHVSLLNHNKSYSTFMRILIEYKVPGISYNFSFCAGLVTLVQLYAYPSMLLAMSQPLFQKVLCVFSCAPDSSHLLPIVSSPRPSVKLLFKCFFSVSDTQIYTYMYRHLCTEYILYIALYHNIQHAQHCCAELYCLWWGSLRRPPEIQSVPFKRKLFIWISKEVYLNYQRVLTNLTLLKLI